MKTRIAVNNITEVTGKLATGLFLLGIMLFSRNSHAALCLPGSYSATGSEPCILAPPGSFVPLAGATSPTPAPRGYYVPVSGAVAAFAAPVGTYQDEEGQAEAKAAPVGYFVAETGSILPSPSPAGSYSPYPGASTAASCKPGTVSRAGSAFCSPAADISDPAAQGPDFSSSLGAGNGNVVDMGTIHQDYSSATDYSQAISLDFTIDNFALVFGSESSFTDLTLIDVFFEGDNADLFQVTGFTPGTVLGASDSLALSITVDSFAMTPLVAISDFITADMIFRTDQGNAFGFDPLDGLYDPGAVDLSYQQYRDAGYVSSLGSGQSRPLSREFGYSLTAMLSVPEPSIALLLLTGVAGMFVSRKRFFV